MSFVIIKESQILVVVMCSDLVFTAVIPCHRERTSDRVNSFCLLSARAAKLALLMCY